MEQLAFLKVRAVADSARMSVSARVCRSLTAQSSQRLESCPIAGRLLFVCLCASALCWMNKSCEKTCFFFFCANTHLSLHKADFLLCLGA